MLGGANWGHWGQENGLNPNISLKIKKTNSYFLQKYFTFKVENVAPVAPVGPTQHVCVRYPFRVARIN
jgi:hypothetical protein